MPSKDILFSIIVPTYNRETFIEKTIRSILAQTYPHFEIIIADDGSKDNTEAVVKAINDERIAYYRKENGERGAARNFGIARAKGDFVTFIDSDDVLYPNHFEEAIKLLKANPMAEVFHLAYEYRDTEANLLDTKKHWRNFNEQLIRGNIISCIGIFIKQGILAGDLLFSENRTLSGTEDWLLWLRLAARYKFHYSNTITACMINHDSRSVLNFDEQAMLTRTNLLMQGLKADDKFMAVYSHYLGRIEAHMLSYIALHLQLSQQKKDAWAYFTKAIKLDIRELFTRRSLAILKRQLL
jgi:glycosyltransferase involved in cell wall biosynthesis